MPGSWSARTIREIEAALKPFEYVIYVVVVVLVVLFVARWWSGKRRQPAS